MHSPYLLIFFYLGSWEMYIWTVDLGSSIAATPSKLETLPILRALYSSPRHPCFTYALDIRYEF